MKEDDPGNQKIAIDLAFKFLMIVGDTGRRKRK